MTKGRKSEKEYALLESHETPAQPKKKKTAIIIFFPLRGKPDRAPVFLEV